MLCSSEVSDIVKSLEFTRSPLRRAAQALSLAVVVSLLPVLEIPWPPATPTLRHDSVPLQLGRAVEVPNGFPMVGVTWPIDEEAPEDLEVRTSRDGKRWSAWQPLHPAEGEGPDPGTEPELRRGSQPLWVGDATRLLELRSALPPSGARVHFIDPGSDPAAPAWSASASPPKPRIISRAAWGADESIRRCCPRYASETKIVFIHHTATGNSYSQGESAQLVRAIYAYHVQTLGWDDIGYNLLVDRYGQVFEGRAGGAHRSVIGAHARGFNTGSSGIAVLGTFSDTKPPDVAADALKWVTAWRMDQDHIDPLGGTTMTSGGSSRYPAGAKVSLKTISGHRDVGETDCPGGMLYGALNWLRHVVAAHGVPKMYNLRTSRPAITPNRDGYSDGVRLRAGFSSAVDWRVDVLDHAGSKVWTKRGLGTSLNVPWWGRDAQNDVVPHGRYRFQISGGNSEGKIRTVTHGVDVWGLPDGTLFVAKPSNWAFMLEKGMLRHITSHQALLSRYRYGEAILVPDAIRTLWPPGAAVGFRDGSIVQVDSKRWLISKQQRRPIGSAEMRNLGYDERAVVTSSSAALRVHPEGSAVKATDGHPEGTALRSSDGREAWKLSGKARPLLTGRIRLSHRINVVDLAGPADAEVTAGASSQPVGFRDGSLLRATTGPVWVIENGMRRRITSDQRFTAMGYKTKNIRQVTEAELSLHREGPPI